MDEGSGSELKADVVRARAKADVAARALRSSFPRLQDL
jgi:hypothetical protein